MVNSSSFKSFYIVTEFGSGNLKNRSNGKKLSLIQRQLLSKFEATKYTKFEICFDGFGPVTAELI